MKKPLFAITALTFMSACTTAPQSTDELRSAVRGGAFLSEMQTHKVSRNYSAVVGSLRAGAQKCMNRNVEVKGYYSPGPNMAPVMQVSRTYYKTSVRNRGNSSELAMHRRNGNGGTVLGMPQEGYAYVVDAMPAGGGTQLNIYGGKMGYGKLNKAVLQWARGGAIRCPELP